MLRRLLALVTLTLVLLLAAGTQRTSDPPTVVVYGSAVTILPDRPLAPGGATGAVVAAARNESASFQVAVRTTGIPAAKVRAVLPGPLKGPQGATIPASAVMLSRAVYYHVDVPTDGEGAPGRWPDELLPDRDPLLHGDGGAFPFDLNDNDTAVLWVDVAVPLRAVPGTYRGQLRLTTGDARLAEVPIQMTVRPFTLPSVSSLRSVFLLNPFDVCGAPRDGYSGAYAQLGTATGCDPGDERTWRVFNRFARLGLRNRISIANPYPTPHMRAPSERDAVRPDPSRPGAPATTADAFDRYVKPLLDGTASLGTLPGAALTALTTTWSCIRDPGADRDCLRDWRTFLADHDRSAASRFVAWTCDEPRVGPTAADPGHQSPWGAVAGDMPQASFTPCEELREQARAGWPGVPVQITTSVDDPGLYPAEHVDPARLTAAATDILTVSVPELVTRKDGSTRPRYEAFLRDPGAQLWLYLACTSGGCDPGTTNPARIARTDYDGWPSYGIDQPGSQASAMGWMAFLYGASGETYYDVALGFDRGPDFHHGIDTFGVNGDGQLFYPGHVRVDGPSGTTTEDMPFESIRLKRIREGREDYEYLHLLETCGHRDDALAVVKDLFGDPDHAMFQTTVTQVQLDAARQDLANLIEQYACG